MMIHARLTKMRKKIAYVFLGIAFLGLTYPLLGIFEGGANETLKTKTDPGYFLNVRCLALTSGAWTMVVSSKPLGSIKKYRRERMAPAYPIASSTKSRLSESREALQDHDKLFLNVIY